ncbi:MAG: DNA-binding protein WhiA [Oscillospiraceae bacterium]|nr:DNA-binding protein WhiA [Oscillospiraceae bacterium]
MSFSGEVKAELCRQEPASRALSQAECYGLLLFANTFTSKEIKIVTSSEELKRRIPRLFRRAFGTGPDCEAGEEGGRAVFYTADPEKLGRIRSAFGMEPESALHINLGALEDPGAREAFLRGAFLAGGSVTDPAKRYHLELTTTHYFVSREMPSLFQEMGLEPKTVSRAGSFVTYFKSSAAIEDVLTALGAPVCAMQVMSAKIEKDMKNSVNRKVNCDTANVMKSVVASEEQIAAIRKIRRAGLMSSLPEKLRQTAEKREELPELSLTELAAAFEPPLTKSGINHRMRKLLAIAREL